MTKLDERWELTRRTIGDGRLSVVMPLYRLAASTEENLRQVADLFERHGVNVELVPVDDGSEDGTGEILSRLSSMGESYRHVTVRPVVCKRNGGKGAALRAGFDASTGRYVMLLDGDLDIHPKRTPYFFEEMVRNDADIVVGSKRHKRSVVQYPWHRRLVSAVYFFLVKLFIGLPITDTQTGMKLFKREVLGPALARMLVKTYAFDLELLSIAHSRGAKIVEAPVRIRFGNKFGALQPSTVKQMSLDSLAVFYRLRILKYYAKAMAPRPLDHDPLVSIVIACPNASWMLKECLSAIVLQSYEKWECIVLPDAEPSSADLVDLPGDPRIRFISTGKVRPAEKRNMGISSAKGEIVAFIDDDAYPEAHWLEYALKYFSEPGIGAVGGPGVTPPGDTWLSRLGGRVYDNILVSGNYRYRYKAGGVRRDVDDYPSCNLFVRKAVLDATGGYRTDFWPGEDTLLCKDIIDSGKRIVYDPWVIVYHHRRALFAPHLRQLGRYAFHRGYFCRKYPSNSLHLSYFIPSAFVLYAVLLPVLQAFPRPICLIASAPMMLYAALVLLSTFALNPVAWIVTAAGVVSTHFVYGVRFVQGLLAKKAPCEFIGKDHA
jgi:glycosyltransferase involved in cell wall biosynthesis